MPSVGANCAGRRVGAMSTSDGITSVASESTVSVTSRMAARFGADERDHRCRPEDRVVDRGSGGAAPLQLLDGRGRRRGIHVGDVRELVLQVGDLGRRV